MRIGIDVGGTNTDAVLMDGSVVRAKVKTPTTPDVTRGIEQALRSLVSASGVPVAHVRAVMIGTTHFTNALVEARRLMPTAVVRLSLPAARSLRPLVDWPDALRAAIGDHVYVCPGGHEFDGRPIADLDRDELARIGSEIAAAGIRSVAISSVFSPVNSEFELETAQILEREAPGIAISLSHEIGRIGLLERENATIVNACLRGLATTITGAFETALGEAGISAPFYLSQNDGTLASIAFVERYPVSTFASGPTNSMRGAAFLSGESECAIVDIGGTTADVGMIVQGYPRDASVALSVAGVRTNFRMPDVLSLGIGGGSVVHSNDEVTVGPDSVGYELSTKALVFGGDVLTASDLAIAGGRASFGDTAGVKELDPDLVTAGLAWLESRIADAVDRMKTSADPIPVVLVGGGSVLLEDTLDGASRVVRPADFDVANAIGAAIAQVGGEVERVYSLAAMTREQALEEATSEAVAKAVEAGAIPETVQVVDVDEIALSYLPGNATQIKVKAIGELDLKGDHDAAIA